jgi:hypothetical protein
LACALGLSLALYACSGGGSSDGPSLGTFPSDLANGLAALGTAAGLSSSSFPDLFDSGYLDSGLTKADVVAALQAEAAAAAGSSAYPSFPQVTVSDVRVTDCDNTTQLCKLTATLTNGDVDTTSVAYVGVVKFTDKVRLYGDQARN